MRLADEIMGLLAPSGELTIKAVSARLGVNRSIVQEAMEGLHDQGAAFFVRDGRTFKLVAALNGRRVCPICRTAFDPPRKSPRLTCSRHCAIVLSWQNPETKARRVAGIIAQKRMPEARARQRSYNFERWARPGEREKLSELNKKRWRDPEARARYGALIGLRHNTPEARAKASAARKAAWADPEIRAKMIAGQHHGRRPAMSEDNRRRWADPALREKYLAAAKINGAKGAASIKGRKQSPEQIAKRAASMKATKARKRLEVHDRGLGA